LIFGAEQCCQTGVHAEQRFCFASRCSAMRDDLADCFAKFLAAQVDELQRNLDTWFRSHMETRCCDEERCDTFPFMDSSPVPSVHGIVVYDGDAAPRPSAPGPRVEPAAGARRPEAFAPPEPRDDPWPSETSQISERPERSQPALQPARPATSERPAAWQHVSDCLELSQPVRREATPQACEMSQPVIYESQPICFSTSSQSVRPASKRIDATRAVLRKSAINGAVLRRSGIGDVGGSAVSLTTVLSSTAAKQRLASDLPLQLELAQSSLMSMARNFVVHWMFAVVVILNAITVGVSTEWHPESTVWFVVDTVFAVYFTIELLYNMRSVGCLRYFCGSRGCCRLFRDGELRWRYFELVMVVSSLLELFFEAMQPDDSEDVGARFNVLRVLRLTRIARILRVCRLSFFVELEMMVSGAIGGIRTLVWSFALLAMPLYLMAMFMHERIGSFKGAGPGAEGFSTISKSWYTMFRCFVASDCATEEGRPIFLLIVNEFGWGYALIFVLMTIFMSVGLFNVIAAIFVENTLAAAKCNNNVHKRQRLLDTQMFAEKAAELVRLVWSVHVHKLTDPSWDVACTPHKERNLQDLVVVPMSDLDIEEASTLQITPQLFNFLRTFKEFKVMLEELDISDEDQLDLFDTLDVDGGGTIDLEEMIVGLSKLRGDARRSDIVCVGLVVRSIQADLKRLRKTVDALRPRS